MAGCTTRIALEAQGRGQERCWGPGALGRQHQALSIGRRLRASPWVCKLPPSSLGENLTVSFFFFLLTYSHFTMLSQIPVWSAVFQSHVNIRILVVTFVCPL